MLFLLYAWTAQPHNLMIKQVPVIILLNSNTNQLICFFLL